jgi:SAM-dependent methyltransferase
MLAIARERAAALGVTNIEFRESDAESLAIEERDFDAAICRWGLMFLPDLPRALAALRERMAPGARFATAVWSTPDKVPMISIGADIVRELANLPAPPPGALEPMRLADTSILKGALEQTGFSDVMIERMPVTFEFARAEDFTQFRVDVAAPFRAMLERQTAEIRKQIIDAVTDAARGFAGPDGKVRTVNETILFAARRSARAG